MGHYTAQPFRPVARSESFALLGNPLNKKLLRRQNEILLSYFQAEFLEEQNIADLYLATLKIDLFGCKTRLNPSKINDSANKLREVLTIQYNRRLQTIKHLHEHKQNSC